MTLAAAAALTGLLGLSDAQAAPAAPQTPLPALAMQDLLQPVHYPLYCRAWRRECADRWDGAPGASGAACGCATAYIASAG